MTYPNFFSLDKNLFYHKCDTYMKIVIFHTSLDEFNAWGNNSNPIGKNNRILAFREGKKDNRYKNNPL